MSRHRVFAIVAVVAATAVALFIGFAVMVLKAQSKMIRDAYCLDWASASVVQYMEDHQGRYPRSRDDLQEAFDKVTAQDRSFSFEEVQSRVFVDFTVDPTVPPDASFQFVRLRSGPGARWNAPDPDERIRSHLLKTRTQSAETPK